MKTRTVKKLLSLLTAVIMVLTILPVTALAAVFSDTDTHWASSAIEKWSDMGHLPITAALSFFWATGLQSMMELLRTSAWRMRTIMMTILPM